MCDSLAEQLGQDHPNFLEVYELLDVVYGNYAEAHSKFGKPEICYKKVWDSRNKQFDKDHPKMLEISCAFEAFEKKRAEQDGKATVKSTRGDASAVGFFHEEPRSPR